MRPSDASNDEDVKAAEQTRVEYADGRLLVKAPKLRSWLLRSDGGSIDVTVELPAGSHVHGERSAWRTSDCRRPARRLPVQDRPRATSALDQAGTLNLKTGAGDVSVDRVDGPRRA